MVQGDDENRIPLDLQKVFLASNQGQEVHEPPRSAFRVFTRRPKWLSYPKNRRLNKKKAKKQQQSKIQESPSSPRKPTMAPSAETSPTNTHNTSRSSGTFAELPDDRGAVSSPRIPLELQSVFVAANRGEEVLQAPQNSFQVFRNFFSSNDAADKETDKQQGRLGMRRMFKKRSTQTLSSSEMSETERVSNCCPALVCEATLSVLSYLALDLFVTVSDSYLLFVSFASTL